jgi:Domain of unknown function (DUF4388)
MINWILAVCFLAAALAAGGFLLRRKSSAPGAPGSRTAPASEPPGGSEANGSRRLSERVPTERLKAAASDSPPQAERPANALQGNLTQTPLHDLLQYLALGRKSGILELVCGRRTGRIVIKDGRVYKNFYRGKDGMEAMYLMLDLAEGDFEFYEQTLEDSVSYSGLEVVDIIMLWMDRKPKKKA